MIMFHSIWAAILLLATVSANNYNGYNYNGYTYAVMDGTPRQNAYNANGYPTCQSDFIEMPAGWELVPYSADIVSNVVYSGISGQYGWGTHVVVFADGTSYWTNSANSHYSTNRLRTSGNSYSTSNCSLKVLMRTAGVNYNGYTYKVMDGTPKSMSYGEGGYPTCQDSYIAMPAGYELAPYSADIVSNVVYSGDGGYAWGTHVVVFADGRSYWTNSANNQYSSNNLQTSGNSYKASGCHLKVLIRTAAGGATVASFRSNHNNQQIEAILYSGGSQTLTWDVQYNACAGAGRRIPGSSHSSYQNKYCTYSNNAAQNVYVTSGCNWSGQAFTHVSGSIPAGKTGYACAHSNCDHQRRFTGSSNSGYSSAVTINSGDYVMCEYIANQVVAEPEPTPGPTVSPTPGPTPGPTVSPTPGPTPAPTCKHELDGNAYETAALNVGRSGFSDSGSLVVAVEFPDLLESPRCYFEDNESEEHFSAFEGEDVAECTAEYRSDLAWEAQRDLMTLKDVSDLDLGYKYRYEAMVICETTKSFEYLSMDMTRDSKQEIPFHIVLPDTVDASATLVAELPEPHATARVIQYSWTILASGSTSQEDLKLALEAEADGTATVEIVDNVVTVTPVISANFETDESGLVFDGDQTNYKALLSAENIANMQTLIDTYDGAANEGTTEVVEIDYEYFHPDVLITKTDAVANLDGNVVITVEVSTFFKRPYKFDSAATVSAAETDTEEISLLTDCEHSEDVCVQEWSIVLTTDDVCAESWDSTEVNISLTPIMSQNDAFAPSFEAIPMDFTVAREQFPCILEIADGEVTASAEMTIFSNAGMSATVPVFYTGETAYFNVAVSTSVDLPIADTELVYLAMDQDSAVTVLLDGGVEVDYPLNGEGLRDIQQSVYSAIESGAAEVVQFSVYLDLDLFAVFNDNEQVNVEFDCTIAISYDTGNRRRRRLLASEFGRDTVNAAESAWIGIEEEEPTGVYMKYLIGGGLSAILLGGLYGMLKLRDSRKMRELRAQLEAQAGPAEI